MAVRTTIRMSLALKRELEELARREGTTFTAVVEEAARSLIARRKAEPDRRSFDVQPLLGANEGPALSPKQVFELIDQAELDYLQRKVGLKS